MASEVTKVPINKMNNQLLNKKIVCLGGGIGTVNLLKGLRKYSSDISVIVSMADEGGSAGRLRRLYNVPPAGDIVSCLAALAEEDTGILSKFLTYRFPGDRYGRDGELSGHKMGNLMMVGAQEIAGSFEGAVELMKKLFHVKNNIYPATVEPVSIKAATVDGVEVVGEENIDLGKYNGERVLDRVYLVPEKPKVSSKALEALENADVIIAGPGDLYTTVLPVLIIPEITEALKKNQKTKIFIVNVANKPFETKGYSVPDFLSAIYKHIGVFPFDKVIVNNNFSLQIPNPFHYSYVKLKSENIKDEVNSVAVVQADLVDKQFPLYHDSDKLAEIVVKNI